MHGCVREEDVIILELLQHIVNSELMLNSIRTQIIKILKRQSKEVKSTLSSDHRIIQEAKFAIISKHIAKK